MRLRHNPNAATFLQTCPLVVWPSGDRPHDWAHEFKNDHPLHLEIGAGKGGFAIAYALANPAVNLIAVERSPTVAAVMAKKAQQVPGLHNLRIIVGNAADLPKWIGKNAVSAIMLNFSDPWPKKRHIHNRLTHIGFINVYRTIARPNTPVTLKTDNAGLYAFTLEHLAEHRFSVSYNSDDFYQGRMPGSGEVVSEYERKFLLQNVPIKKIVFHV